jgi:heme/copper-type cytochrome/quinol oxidase subunit 2
MRNCRTGHPWCSVVSAVAFSLVSCQMALAQAGQTADSTSGSDIYQVSLLRLSVAIAAGVAMLVGMWLVFARLKHKQQGFGPNSLKALGLVLFVPALLMISVAVPGFQTETLAALLGTVAGYVLSHSKAEDT